MILFTVLLASHSKAPSTPLLPVKPAVFESLSGNGELEVNLELVSLFLILGCPYMALGVFQLCNTLSVTLQRCLTLMKRN